jgi:hypothetical protein
MFREEKIMIFNDQESDALENLPANLTLAAIKESLRDVAAGRTFPIRQALEKLAKKHNLVIPAED